MREIVTSNKLHLFPPTKQSENDNTDLAERTENTNSQKKREHSLRKTTQIRRAGGPRHPALPQSFACTKRAENTKPQKNCASFETATLSQKDSTDLAHRGPCATLLCPSQTPARREQSQAREESRLLRGKNWLARGLSAPSAPCVGFPVLGTSQDLNRTS